MRSNLIPSSRGEGGQLVAVIPQLGHTAALQQVAEASDCFNINGKHSDRSALTGRYHMPRGHGVAYHCGSTVKS